MKATKKYKKNSSGTKYKFGVIVSRTGVVCGSMKLEKENENTLWFEVQMKEASTLRDSDTFARMLEDVDLSAVINMFL